MIRYFYKNSKSGEVFEFDSVAHFESTGKKDLIKMSCAEVEAHLTPPNPTRADVDIARLIAFADPVTGSDRYKAEAYAKRLVGDEDAAAEADQKLVKRREEIQAANPWPKD